MKIFCNTVLICALSFHIQEISGGREILEGNNRGGLDIKETIESFLANLKLKIPETFTFADQNFTIPNNQYVKGTVNFSSITCTGLKEFNATVIYGSFVPIPKAYTLILDNLNLNVEYKTDVALYNSKFLSVFGTGSANINLKNLIFDGNVSLSFIPINATTNVEIDLDNVLVNITGLLNDKIFSEDSGKFISLTAKTIFDKYKVLLSERVSKTLNFVIQHILAHPQHINNDENTIRCLEDCQEDMIDPLNNFINLL